MSLNRQEYLEGKKIVAIFAPRFIQEPLQTIFDISVRKRHERRHEAVRSIVASDSEG